MRCRSFASVLVTAMTLAACGRSADETASDGPSPSSTVAVTPVLPASSTDAVSTPTETTVEVEARSLPPLPSSTSPSTVAPTTVAPTTATPTTEREPFAVEWSRPSGSFELATDDVVGLTVGGALVLFQAIASVTPTSEILVADISTALGDSRIEAFGGVVAGALIFGTCCGDDAGLWSLGSERGVLRRFAAGQLPAYSADRDWLVALGRGGDELLVHDVPSELVTSPPFEAGAGADEVSGVLWAADDESWFLTVGDSDDAGELVQVEARPPFEQLAATSLEAVFPDAVSSPTFAGLGPTGDIALWALDGDEVVMKFVDPATLQEHPDRQRTLPPTASSVRIGTDGGSLIWIDGGTLRFLPLFADERVLGEGFVAAWFVD